MTFKKYLQNIVSLVESSSISGLNLKYLSIGEVTSLQEVEIHNVLIMYDGKSRKAYFGGAQNYFKYPIVINPSTFEPTVYANFQSISGLERTILITFEFRGLYATVTSIKYGEEFLSLENIKEEFDEDDSLLISLSTSKTLGKEINFQEFKL